MHSTQRQMLILASASPRRRELLGYMDIPFEIVTADAEEEKQGAPDWLVEENARRKALAVAALHPDRWVLGADTIVYQTGNVLGKPRSVQHAREMLQMLQNNTHEVYTGVCLARNDRVIVRHDVTQVCFTPISGAAIDAYIASGEPMDKAGAYAVQGRAGMFVRSISGSYSNVIGLPMALTREMLREAGFDLP